MTKVSLTVNGERVEADVEPRLSLADYLRHQCRLTGTHLGCEHGVCGACTVLLDGAPARSCIAFAAALEGREVRTVEGFADDPVMSRLRAAFHEEHALQCGFCTSGMLITARDIVTRFASADEARIRVELAGNLCRCTGYMGIVAAIARVLREMPAEARLGKAVPLPRARAAGPAPFLPFAARSEAAPPAARAAGAVAWESEPESGWTRISESFAIASPPAEVWRFFGDLPRVTRAMPGAELTASGGERLAGRLAVAFGPIRASFAGEATHARSDAAMTGVLRGGGSDARGGSHAKGEVRYRLIAEPDGHATRVELALDYQLQGPLAQFARPGLVKDFAGRLVAAFARNLQASLAGGEDQPQVAAAPLGAGSTLLAVIWGRIKRWLGR